MSKFSWRYLFAESKNFPTDGTSTKVLPPIFSVKKSGWISALPFLLLSLTPQEFFYKLYMSPKINYPTPYQSGEVAASNTSAAAASHPEEIITDRPVLEKRPPVSPNKKELAGASAYPVFGKTSAKNVSEKKPRQDLDEEGNTPLMESIMYGELDEVEKLLLTEKDLSHRNDLGHNIFNAAIFSSDTAKFQAVLSRITERDPEILHEKNPDGTYPIMNVIKNKALGMSCIMEMLDKGVSIDIRDKREQHFLVSLAQSHDDASCLIFLNRIAAVNPNFISGSDGEKMFAKLTEKKQRSVHKIHEK